MPWSGDGYGPLDFTLFDKHHGTIDDWRDLVNAIHDRDMYIILDNTMSTYVIADGKAEVGVICLTLAF